MGLDNYAMRGPEEELTGDDVAAFEAEAPNLCGGIAGSDEGSFRGKVCAKRNLGIASWW